MPLSNPFIELAIAPADTVAQRADLTPGEDHAFTHSPQLVIERAGHRLGPAQALFQIRRLLAQTVQTVHLDHRPSFRVSPCAGAAAGRSGHCATNSSSRARVSGGRPAASPSISANSAGVSAQNSAGRSPSPRIPTRINPGQSSPPAAALTGCPAR
jgi:hypothetical protein